MSIWDIIEVVVSVLLIITILLQNKGSGLGAGFGGSTGAYYTKRGAEKFLFNLSIVLSVVYILLAVFLAVR